MKKKFEKIKLKLWIKKMDKNSVNKKLLKQFDENNKKENKDDDFF